MQRIVLPKYALDEIYRIFFRFLWKKKHFTNKRAFEKLKLTEGRVKSLHEYKELCSGHPRCTLDYNIISNALSLSHTH